MSDREKSELEAAKSRRFVLNKPNNKEVYNSYFDWCDSLRLPLVEIRPKVKYATVHMDMITAQCKLNDNGQEQVKELFHSIEAHGVQGIREIISSEICQIKGVLIEESEEIAAKLLSIATHQAYVEQY